MVRIKTKYNYLIKHPTLDVRRGFLYATNSDDALQMCVEFVKSRRTEEEVDKTTITIKEDE